MQEAGRVWARPLAEERPFEEAALACQWPCWQGVQQ